MSAEPTTLQLLARWSGRRWVIAMIGAIAALLVVGVLTAIIQTPWFSRTIPPTWWSWPVLLIASLMTGLLVATYVAASAPETPASSPARRAGIGGLLNFFAVGCPVCNKLVLLAVGSSGAIRWFQPVQPLLSLLGLVLLGWALRIRMRASQSCRRPSRPRRTFKALIMAAAGDVKARIRPFSSGRRDVATDSRQPRERADR